MGSLLSSLKSKTTTSNEKSTSTPAKMGSTGPLTFSHYANAQTEFTKTLPLIGNENAFLADIFSSYVPSQIHTPFIPRSHPSNP